MAKSTAFILDSLPKTVYSRRFHSSQSAQRELFLKNRFSFFAMTKVSCMHCHEDFEAESLKAHWEKYHQKVEYLRWVWLENFKSFSMLIESQSVSWFSTKSVIMSSCFCKIKLTFKNTFQQLCELHWTSSKKYWRQDY